ncbi:alpha/beta fold hydrolase [Glaciecola sp. SC05]|uniref:alpha/beta fold hydrolase n=1 Tax=Glaciecola sp. SC05 TaxID=1987355 RepID=UPI0035299950
MFTRKSEKLLSETLFYSHRSTKIAYQHTEIRKQTIVFIHGNSACKEVFEQQIEALSDEYRLILLDLPGHGESSNSNEPMQDYTIPGYAVACISLLQSIKVVNPIIMGWSLGGHVALEMVGQGYSACGLLITGTPPIGRGLSDFEHAFQANEVMALTGKQAFTDDDAAKYLSALYSTSIINNFVIAAQRTDPIAREAMVAHWSAGVDGVDEKALIASWDRPIAVIHGENDQFVNLDYLTNLIWKNLWKNKILSVRNAGHSPFLEQPIVFNQYILTFAHSCFNKEK